MNCTEFDKCIELTFEQYGQLGVNVSLLTVLDRHSLTPPGDWIQVSVEVIPVVPHPKPVADTWYYGGVISKETGPVPIGIRMINRNQLVGSERAARALPEGFDLRDANANLSWPLTPECPEPMYFFYNQMVSYSVGAYSGEIYTR